MPQTTVIDRKILIFSLILLSMAVFDGAAQSRMRCEAAFSIRRRPMESAAGGVAERQRYPEASRAIWRR